MNRVLTFHEKDIVGSGSRIGATYYMNTDCEPIAVRIHAERAAPNGDIEVDIFDDGVSIFSNTAADYEQPSTSIGATITSDTPKTSVALAKDENASELVANEFGTDIIENGSWVHCEITKLNGAKNITVHLELNELD